LTEGGPIPIPESVNGFQIAKDGSRFTAGNPNLGANVEGHFSTDSVELSSMDFDDSYQEFCRKPIDFKATSCIKVSPDIPVTLALSIHLRADDSFTPAQTKTGYDTLHAPTWKLQDPEALGIIHGNLEYVLGNCMIPISETSTCVITDHVALPLGWNRDN
jgi:hypothetical protein